jgi:hypothetical protein
MRYLILAATLIAAPALAQPPELPKSSAVSVLSVSDGPNAVMTIADCCTIHQGGKVELREGLKLDDASRAFWATISQFGMRHAHRCAYETTFQVMAGATATGRFDIPEVKGDQLPAFHLAEGTELKGPLRIDICDGRVTVSKDVTP